MADRTKSELEKQLEEAEKEITHYKRISKEGGDIRLREAEALSKLVAELKRAEKALQTVKDELEKRVEERTAQLLGANLILKQEISERKRAEEALRESEQRFRSIAETTSDWVWEVDPNGFYTYSNPKVRDLLGREPAEVVGKKPFDFMPEDEKGRVSKLFMNFVEFRQPFSHLENVNLHKDGRRIMLETSGVPIFDERGNYSGHRGIDRDITERKRMEEEQLKISKLESTGILAGGIAHDFNNLITAILGNIELAKMATSPGGEAWSYLNNAEKSGIIAKGLTSQLITFAKGGGPITKVISIKEQIEDSTIFALSGSNVQCEFSIPNDLWLVKADDRQVRQVIQNMVLNAREAMPEGGTIFIRAKNVTLHPQQGLPLPEGEYLRLSIEDRGSGIPEELLSKIFDPYFSTKRRGNQKGMGLGLTVCHSIVKNHGGYIQVESRVKKGTTFHIYLPVFKGKVTSELNEIKKTVRSKGRVLVMDDEEMMRSLVGEVLKQIGYEAELSGDGEEAIVLYKKAIELEKPFGAVILDLTVRGGMGAKETIKRLLDINPNVKALILSGYSNDPIMFGYKEYGFKGALAKPFQISQLSQMVSKILDAP